jgi:hypothetical protein
LWQKICHASIIKRKKRNNSKDKYLGGYREKNKLYQIVLITKGIVKLQHAHCMGISMI